MPFDSQRAVQTDFYSHFCVTVQSPARGPVARIAMHFWSMSVSVLEPVFGRLASLPEGIHIVRSTFLTDSHRPATRMLVESRHGCRTKHSRPQSFQDFDWL